MSLKSNFKGFLGETVINVAMWLKLDNNIYHRMGNVTLPLANGGSTQIDHIIVSVYGIFVIETKNYKGWIYGSERQRQWTQAFANGRKYKFQNPLHQNYLHIKTLADLLDLEMRYFHSMIAFIGECEIKTPDALPEHVLTSGMVSYVQKKQDKILSEDDVQAIVEQIHTKRFSKSWRTNRQHKAYLKEKHAQPNKQTPNQAQEIKTAKDSVPDTTKERPKVHIYERWSGQTEIETSRVLPDDVSTQQINTAHDMSDKTFLTPFGIIELELVRKDLTTTEPDTIKAVADSDVNYQAVEQVQSCPKCPKCQGEMVKRIAKQGTRAGQAFYGCAQFPKCRGVVNIN